MDGGNPFQECCLFFRIFLYMGEGLAKTLDPGFGISLGQEGFGNFLQAFSGEFRGLLDRFFELGDGFVKKTVGPQKSSPVEKIICGKTFGGFNLIARNIIQPCYFFGYALEAAFKKTDDTLEFMPLCFFQVSIVFERIPALGKQRCVNSGGIL
jgi:hypothetical protein